MAGFSLSPGKKIVDQIPYLRLVESLPEPQTEESLVLDDDDHAPKSSSHKSILIIEDEAGVRALLEDLFFMEGYDTTSAPDGQQGISRFKAHPFDLVFTDLRMPGISGSDVARAVKQCNANTPVVLVTGWDTEPFEDEIIDSGVDRVLYKPFDMDEILSLVVELIGRSPSNPDAWISPD
jgi:DNA-binding response OmpR family regulator